MPCYLHIIVVLPFIVLFLAFIYSSLDKYLSKDEYLSNDSLSLFHKHRSGRYFIYLPLLLILLWLIDVYHLDYIECVCCGSLIGYSIKSFLDLAAHSIIYIGLPIIFIILFDFIFLNSIVAKIKNFVLPIQFYKEEINRDTLFLNKNKPIPLNDAPKSKLAYILSTNYRFNGHGVNDLTQVVNFLWLLELYRSRYKKFLYPFVLSFVSFLFYLAVVLYFRWVLPNVEANEVQLKGSVSFVFFSVIWSLYTIVWLKKLFGINFFIDSFPSAKTSFDDEEYALELNYLTLYSYDDRSGNRENVTDKLLSFYKQEIKKSEEKELELALAFTITVLLAIALTILV